MRDLRSRQLGDGGLRRVVTGERCTAAVIWVRVELAHDPGETGWAGALRALPVQTLCSRRPARPSRRRGGRQRKITCSGGATRP